MGSNPLIVTIPVSCVGQVIAMTNSSWGQRATVSIDNVQVGVFEGTGAATPMQLITGAPSIPISTTRSTQSCSIFFEYSPTSGTWAPATVNSPVTTTADNLTTIQITTEDTSSLNNNNTVIMISLFSTAASGDREKLTSQTSAPEDILHFKAMSSTDTPNSVLELHAKTYYDNPQVQGGDEHYTFLDFDNARPDPSGRRIIPGFSRSTGWQDHEVNCEWTSGVIWNTVTVTVTAWNCQYSGMESAQLFIMASTWCLGNQPSSWPSPDWNGDMKGSAYQLVRVTP